MRTNIDLDSELVEQAMELTGISQKKQLVHEALRTLIAVKKRRSISDLLGKVKLDDKYDYKVKRSRQ